MTYEYLARVPLDVELRTWQRGAAKSASGGPGPHRGRRPPLPSGPHRDHRIPSPALGDGGPRPATAHPHDGAPSSSSRRAPPRVGPRAMDVVGPHRARARAGRGGRRPLVVEPPRASRRGTTVSLLTRGLVRGARGGRGSLCTATSLGPAGLRRLRRHRGLSPHPARAASHRCGQASSSGCSSGSPSRRSCS